MTPQDVTNIMRSIVTKKRYVDITVRLYSQTGEEHDTTIVTNS